MKAAGGETWPMRIVATDSAEEAQPPWPMPEAAWRAVALFSLAAILSYTDRQILALLVDPIRTGLRIDDTEVGMLQGLAFAVVYACVGLPLGRLADAFPRRWVIVGGVGLWTAATVACGLARNFPQLLLARVFVGAGEATLAPAAMSMIGDYFPPSRRATAIGVFLMGTILGGGLAYGIGGALVQASHETWFKALPGVGSLPSWRAVLLILGVPGVLVAGLLVGVPEPPRRRDEADSCGTSLSETAKALTGSRPLLCALYLAMALTSVGDFSLLSWAPAYLSRDFGYGAGEIGGILLLILVAAGVLGSVGGGFIADRLARRALVQGRLKLASLCALIGLFAASIGVVSSDAQVLALFALWNLMSAASGTAGVASLQELVPNRARGFAIALVSFCNILLGLGIGATLTGVLTDHLYGHARDVGLSLSTVMAPAACAAALLFWRAYRQLPQPREQIAIR